MAATGLLSERRVGNQRRFRAGRAAVLRTLARFRLLQPRVFGSVARGEDTESSDLDLLVEAGPRTSLLDLAAARNALEDALGVRVDLVTADDLPGRIREAVLA